MKWGILGALEQEIALLLENMQVENSRELFGSRFVTGTIAGQQAVVACCGIGKVNASACATALILEFGADRIVNVGIAGAMSEGLNVLDVVISRDLVVHDVDHALFDQYYPYVHSFEADTLLVEQAGAACRRLGIRHIVGRIATGDVFVESNAVKNAIKEEHKPDCVEMEGAAVAQVAHMLGKPFVVIRSMSDNADEGAQQSYDNLLERAAGNSARILLAMLGAF